MPISPNIGLNQELTIYAKGLKQSAAAAKANFIFGRLTVGSSIGRYKLFSDQQAFDIPDTNMPSNGEPNLLDFGSYEAQYTCKQQGIAQRLTKADLDAIAQDGNNDPLNVINAIINMLSGRAIRAHEAHCAAAIATSVAANVVSDGTGIPTGTTTQWTLGTDKQDPIAEIDAAILAVEAKTGMQPNRMSIDPQSWVTLKNHPAVKSRMPYGVSYNGLTPEILKGFLANPTLEIQIASLSRAKNKANAGQKTSKTFIWKGGALLFIGNEAPDQYDPSAFKCFVTASSTIEAVHSWTHPAGYFTEYAALWNRDLQVTSPLSAIWLPIS